MLISLPPIPLDGAKEYTGNAWPFTSTTCGLDDPTDTDTDITRFAQVGVEELHDPGDREFPPLVPSPS